MFFTFGILLSNQSYDEKGCKTLSRCKKRKCQLQIKCSDICSDGLWLILPVKDMKIGERCHSSWRSWIKRKDPNACEFSDGTFPMIILFNIVVSAASPIRIARTSAVVFSWRRVNPLRFKDTSSSERIWIAGSRQRWVQSQFSRRDNTFQVLWWQLFSWVDPKSLLNRPSEWGGIFYNAPYAHELKAAVVCIKGG